MTWGLAAKNQRKRKKEKEDFLKASTRIEELFVLRKVHTHLYVYVYVVF